MASMPSWEGSFFMSHTNPQLIRLIFLIQGLSVSHHLSLSSLTKGHFSNNSISLLSVANQTKVTLQQKIPEKFPNESESSIKDRSKADGLTKVFALLQCIWLLAQAIVRGYAGLSISELELATIAFIPCTFAMYIIWFDKGFDVEHVTIIKISPEEFRRMDVGRPKMEAVDSIWYIKELSLKILWFKVILVDEELSYSIVQIFVYTTGTIFSALHMIAWNWKFPSRAVLIAWRCCSVMAVSSTLSPILLLFVVIISSGANANSLFDRLMNVFRVSMAALMLFIALLYPFARLGLIVLIFYCFYSMPAAVYQTTSFSWIDSVPHFT